MGVNYAAYYGIGVQITKAPKGLDVYEYMEELQANDEEFAVTTFIHGSEYSSSRKEFYICIQDPFEYGVDGLKKKVEDFLDFLKRHNVQYSGNVDCVGALHVT